jgi:hypothetical protein
MDGSGSDPTKTVVLENLDCVRIFKHFVLKWLFGTDLAYIGRRLS